MKNLKNMPSRHCEKRTEWATRQSPITARPEIHTFRLASFAMTKAFTLVELIVVITILVILGTIAFISLGGYAASARDSARVENLSNLHKGLSVFQVKSGKYPMPESSVNITASGTIIGYQGFAKESVGTFANISKGGTVDPSDPTMYMTYSVNARQDKIALMAFLEEGSNLSFVPELYAASDYSKRYPLVTGDTIGILLGNTGSSFHQPVQETGTGVDVVNTGTGYSAYFTSQEIIIGTGGTLFTSIYNRNTELVNNKSLANLDKSLIAYWDMETLSGTNLKDFSRYGNDGSIIGGIIAGSVQGKNGKGMQFSGDASQGISIPNNTVFNIWANDNFSVFMSVKTPLLQNFTGWAYHYNCLMEKWASGEGYPFTVRIKTQNDVIWYNGNSAGYPGKMLTARYDGVNNPGAYSNKSIADNGFHALLFTKKEQKLFNYIDGSVESESIDTTTGNTVSTATLSIGRCTNGTLPYSWIIDEVRIYNRALAPSEIRALYDATR